MAERNEKVLERVRQELAKNPKLGSRELYDAAQELDRSVGQDSLQQFHARYVLPVKREHRSSDSSGEAKAQPRGRKGKAQQKPAAEPAPEPEAAKPGRTKRSAKVEEGSDRDRIRRVLLQFARDFAEADSRSEIVQVVSRVDDYVEKIASTG